MKHRLILLTLVAGILVFSGCQPTKADRSTPDGALTVFLEAFKQGDAEALREMSLEGEDLSQLLGSGENDPIGQLIYQKIRELTYKVGKPKVDGEEAKVPLTMDVPDVSAVIEKLFIRSAEEVANDPSFDEGKLMQWFQEEMKKDLEQKIDTKKVETDVLLKNIDNQWTFHLENNQTLLNALIQGL